MKLPERQDILDYLEGASGQDAQLQKQILFMLASSPLLREQMAELKKDLYLISAQVPEYQPEARFGAEVAKLAQTWLGVVYGRKFSMKQFYRSREFFGLMALVLGGLGLLYFFLGLINMR